MQNRWDAANAAQFIDDLGLRVYSSRLLGQDPALVLHGGGNTSVKLTEADIFGEPQEILYVKGSGWDLQDIDRPGFSPVRLDHLVRLATLPGLSDPQMVNELKSHMTRAGAPTPSVEAILHALLPFKYADHTHADAIVTITNTDQGEARIREIFGSRVVIVPYVMPGFDLARQCAARFAAEAGPQTEGMVLLNHGIFSFGDTAKQSYDRMIALVNEAEAYLRDQGAWELESAAGETPPPSPRAQAELRRRLSGIAGGPLLLCAERDACIDRFLAQPDLARISQQGPATPDHVIRTKQKPLLGRDVEAYARSYAAYFERHAPLAKEAKTMLDPAPRVILDGEMGLISVGRSARDAAIISDIYHHSMDIMLRAERLGGYQALPDADIFDVEYWDLEQAKLRSGRKPPVFSGEIALVTGAASGIGRACVDSLLARGAAVIGLDIDPRISEMHSRPDFLGLVCDVADAAALSQALTQGVSRFGGLDMLILNAGIFPGGARIEELDDELWHKVMHVNLDANLKLMRAAVPYLKLAPGSGRVVVIGSKNVPAPGPGAAAYSCAKAALTQLSRIAALEWAGSGIRINILHPDAVFDTGIWTEQVLQARAAHYGLSVQEYKTKNLLKREVTSRDVAELAAEMCGPLFAKTTAAQVPVDGGNDRVI